MLSAKAAQVMLATGNDKLSNSTKCLEETRCKIQNLKRKLENFERPSQKEPAAKKSK
jgi:hypothetical protein